MKLYEINQQIDDLLSMVDENGELDEQAFALIEALQIAETEKIESIGCYVKGLRAEVNEFSEEIKTLKARMDAKDRKADRLALFLQEYLFTTGKSKFETARVALSFRKSERVDIMDEEAVKTFADSHIDMGLVKVKTEVSKTAVKSAIKSGIDIPGAVIVTGQNLQVK